MHGIDFIDSLFHRKVPSPLLKFCGANNNQFVFAPDGCVYPCWWGHGDMSNCLGRYDSNICINESVFQNWQRRNVLILEQCKNCKYRFLCGGGCTYKALEKTRSVMNGNCADFYNIFQIYLEYYYEK